MSATATICSFVVGDSAVTILSPLRNTVTEVSMKNTGLMITCYAKPCDARVLERALLSKCGTPVSRCAEPTDEYT